MTVLDLGSIMFMALIFSFSKFYMQFDRKE